MKSPGPEVFLGDFYQERINANFSQPLPNRKIRITSQLILCGQYYPNTKIRKMYLKKNIYRLTSPINIR